MEHMDREGGDRNAHATGGTLHVVLAANQYVALQIIAGPNGCWFFADLQEVIVGGAPNFLPLAWKTFANEAAAPVLQAPFTGVLAPTMRNYDAARPVSSSIRCGGSLLDMTTVPDAPVACHGDITIRSNGFFHVGPGRMRPMQWLAPLHVFHMQSLLVSNPLVISLYVTVNIEEPISGASPR